MSAFDPRAKLIWALSGMLAIFLLDSVFLQIGLLAGILLLIKLSGFSITEILGAVKYLLILLPITFLVHLFFTTGLLAGLFQSGGLIPGHFNWQIPLQFTLRLANLILLMSFLIKWITPLGFLDAIYLWLAPLRALRLPVDDLFQLIFIAVRFFPLVQDEYKRLDQGWNSFLPDRDHNWRSRVSRIRERLIPLMIFSFRKAEVLAEVMSMRGYGINPQRSYYTHLQFGPKDALFATGGVLILGVVIVLKTQNLFC